VCNFRWPQVSNFQWPLTRTTDSIDCEECYGSLDVDSTTTSLTITSTLSYVISDESIHKIGKTTGWSYGNVEATCVDVGSAFLPGGDIVLCSDRIDYNAEDGDSGGPAFSVISGTNVQLRGIHWGSDPVTSDGYISNLGQIQIDLGGLTYYDPGSPSVTISGPTQVPGGGVQCTWEANVFDGVRPYTYTWSGLLSGSGSDAGITGPVYNSGTLYVTVTDFFGRQAFGNIGVTVVQGPPVCD